MFPPPGVVRVPNLAQPENPPQIVHVPMGAPGKAQVMPYSPAESSGTEGAADVHIGSLADGQQSELADLDDTATRCPKDQCVRSRLGANRLRLRFPTDSTFRNRCPKASSVGPSPLRTIRQRRSRPRLHQCEPCWKSRREQWTLRASSKQNESRPG